MGRLTFVFNQDRLRAENKTESDLLYPMRVFAQQHGIQETNRAPCQICKIPRFQARTFSLNICTNNKNPYHPLKSNNSLLDDSANRSTNQKNDLTFSLIIIFPP